MVKTALRIRSNTFDATEIMPLIEACMADLKLAGVQRAESYDPLVRRAIVLYVKANFGYSEDSARYDAAYSALKNAMALSGEYGGFSNEIS